MKKLTLIVLLSLFAAACSGSSADDAIGIDTETTESAETGDSGENSDDTDPPTSEDLGIEEDAELADLPEPLEATTVEARECAHSLADLGIEATSDAPEDVPLPPNEKPDVDDEFLVPVNELVVTDLIEGTGNEATSGANISMQYVGVLADGGEQFDASWDRGATFDFQLGVGQVIPGWDEGIQGMRVGGRRVLQIPAAQAYGDQGAGEDIPPNSSLVFIVDLVTAPAGGPGVDPALLGTFGELQMVDLVEGEGCIAGQGDIVSMNYVGVDADGNEIDNSWVRGSTLDVIVGRSQVIDGWNEGLVGMAVGGERILQIPSDQAYGDGDLVFRVHLEALIEAPPAHLLTFEGDAPTDLQIETLVEGEGDGSVNGDIIDANIMVALYGSNEIIQSTWQMGAPTQLALQSGGLLPGLEEGLIGMQQGETRQIIIPSPIAYPDGIPPEAGIEADDALVFIVDVLRLTSQ